MKSFFSFFLLIVFSFFCIFVYSQGGSPNLQSNPSSPQNNPEAIWDVQLNVNVTGSGAVKDGSFFYVADKTSNLIRAYDASGNLLLIFAIPGVTGLEDLAFDGTFEYGGTGGQVIYQMSFQTQTLVGTINTPIAVRHIAYDPNNDAFWVGGWSDPVMLIARNGAVLATVNVQLSPVTGSAYDDVSPGGPYLWLFTGGAPDSLMIRQYHILSGTLTGVTHNVLSDIGIGVTNASSGGLFFMNDFIANTASLGGVLMGSPAKLFAYEIYNAVPVELSSFTAEFVGQGVKLQWTTATETNNLGFEIQRSVTGGQKSEVRGQGSEIAGHRSGVRNWERIGYVEGSGTTIEPKSYSFIDKNIKAGTYCYRLKQIDLDGTYEYSDAISIEVNIGLGYVLFQNYPNPFNPATRIKYSIPESGFVTLKVYDLLGREVAVLVNEEKTAGSHPVEFDGSSLPSGVYVYRIQIGDYSAVRKMVLVR